MQLSEPKQYQLNVAGKDIQLEVGKVAQQADAAVTCRCGDTYVLATVVMSNEIRDNVDYMPLLVDYEEKYYAAGKIKGSRFIKREGRPSDAAVTTGRMIDRAIRPLFPKRMINDVQVVTTVLSYDDENHPDIPALIAASTALSISRIPWAGPLGAVRVGRKNGEFSVNFPMSEAEQNDLDMIVAATNKEAVMLEADAKEVPEEDVERGISEGVKEAGKIAEFIAGIQEEIGDKKEEPITFDIPEELEKRVRDDAWQDAEQILQEGGKKSEVNDKFTELNKIVAERLDLKGEEASLCGIILRDIHQEISREWILNEGRRLNDRKPAEVRPLEIEVGMIPRTHGSALFKRGETQILTTLTLGAPGDSLILDTMTEEETKKHYMHFYNFPAFSVGEIKPNRGPGRRDIGHGALAERALNPVIPDSEEFNYTVLAVSEVLSSNGSSSMASACGSSLALMDGGVPLKAAVAGIAMGLVTDEKDQGRDSVVLTDIAGMEDEGGDMDFKVAGTKNGVTAIQVDIKVNGLTPEVIQQALTGAREARLKILEAMNKVISEPRKELSPYAPRMITMKINPEKIGDLIGPRGKHINEIIEKTKVQIDVEDDGLVTITSDNDQGIEKAEELVKNLTREVKPGERFEGKVTRLMKFGAFVEILPGTEGLVHISELAPYHVNKVEDEVKVGDVIPVVVTEIDKQGRINLSHKRAKEVE